MSSKRTVVLASVLAAFALALPLAAQEGQARYDWAIVSDSKESFDEKAVIGPDVPKIYLLFSVGDVPKGARLKAAWIAEDVAGNAKNSTFDKSESASKGGSYSAAFSLGKPQGGWPTGAYRVDLFIDGQLKKSIKFKIGKA